MGTDPRAGRAVAPLALLLSALALLPAPARAAIACDLNDPDRDVPRLVPGATGWHTRYVSIGDPVLRRRVEDRLGRTGLSLYAPLEVPYTLYEVERAGKKVGTIHGVNQKGQFGAIQLFIAQDLSGRVTAFYIQKISGPSAGKFRAAAFAARFIGLTLADFDAFDPVAGHGTGRVAGIPNPAPDAETDFFGVLRGLKKNLVLMEELVFAPERRKP
jgi:hypothetical protein